MPFEFKRFLFKRRSTIQRWMQENDLKTIEDIEKELSRDSLYASNEDMEEIKHLLKPLIAVDETDSVLIPVLTEDPIEENPLLEKKINKKIKPIDDKKKEA